MKLLISWIAAMHDFQRDEESKKFIGVDKNGPNYNFHKSFFSHDKHILLSSNNGKEPDPLVEGLRTCLIKDFPDHLVEVRYMEIKDVINIQEIKSRVEGLLLREFENDQIDIFFSPGTSAMQISWYLIHESQLLTTKMFQVRPQRFSKTGRAELLEMQVIKSTIPGGSVIKEEGVGHHKEDYVITESLKQVYSHAEMIGGADQVTTLIYGESGTGKEHLANYIHNRSARNDKPFIAINCSAFTDELLGSRLFGHKKGSFTGAIEDHMGLFQEARGGTIFLDEIGDISPYMQQSLLRVIQEKKVLGVGFNKEVEIDVRIVAATNKDLSSLCAEGKFRWDLYYRLAITELILPPLRERKESERKELIDFFLKTKKITFKRSKQLVLDKEALRIILNYPFPGNVRELENLIESLYVFNSETVIARALPHRLLVPVDNQKMDLKTVEKLHIIKVLKVTRSKQQAAKLLGCVINTLEKKIKDYQIDSSLFVKNVH
ncbi:sigma-54-dependent Fis family transcriptional regulator [Sphingobacterium sp. DN00404]|uniref:Sigma-54-dependent Fis family transcriptional regulator n=2 Tax=Sphingobacterium micropteri TaxID=2763501 RepID=A0ABR7YT58_9SPHI|nr:sigma-54-dependent Fis family transcriptional regulator [Sphingobacterium micropteri]